MISQATRKPLTVDYIQLTKDTLDEALEFISLPRKAVWVHPQGGFSNWDMPSEGDEVGIFIFEDMGGELVTSGSYIVKDQDGDYLFMTESRFEVQFATKKWVPVVDEDNPDFTDVPGGTPMPKKKPEPTPTASVTPKKAAKK